jgi:hypothetical protein
MEIYKIGDMINGKEYLAEIKGISLRLTVLATCEITIPLNFQYF